MRTERQRNCYIWFIILIASVITSSAFAEELDFEPPASSVGDIQTPMQQVFPEKSGRPSLFPGIRQHLQELSPFFADTRLDVHYRTYYLYKDRTTDVTSEA